MTVRRSLPSLLRRILHESEGRGLLDSDTCHFGVLWSSSVDDVVELRNALLATTILQGVDNAEIQQADVLREDVEIGECELRERHLVSIFAVIGNEAVNIPQGGEAELLEHMHEGPECSGVDLCLVHSGYATIQTVEWMEFEITVERIAVELYIVELS